MIQQDRPFPWYLIRLFFRKERTKTTTTKQRKGKERKGKEEQNENERL